MIQRTYTGTIARVYAETPMLSAADPELRVVLAEPGHAYLFAGEDAVPGDGYWADIPPYDVAPLEQAPDPMEERQAWYEALNPAPPAEPAPEPPAAAAPAKAPPQNPPASDAGPSTTPEV